MRKYQNTAVANEEWDMGLSELIEETPTQTTPQLKQFREASEQDGTHVYMMRPKPSWKKKVVS